MTKLTDFLRSFLLIDYTQINTNKLLIEIWMSKLVCFSEKIFYVLLLIFSNFLNFLSGVFPGPLDLLSGSNVTQISLLGPLNKTTLFNLITHDFIENCLIILLVLILLILLGITLSLLLLKSQLSFLDVLNKSHELVLLSPFL